MIPLSTTEIKGLEFDASLGEVKRPFQSQASKIGWMQSIADQPDAHFDIRIKDALGRVKFERKNCTSNTERFGELINCPVLLGEHLQVEIDNVKGAKKIQVFLN